MYILGDIFVKIYKKMTTPQEQDNKPQIPENEIRVGGRTSVFNTIARIEEVFKKFDNIVISGLNEGISKVLLITEITRLKFEGLHQYNLIETITTEMRDEERGQGEEDSKLSYTKRNQLLPLKDSMKLLTLQKNSKS